MRNIVLLLLPLLVLLCVRLFAMAMIRRIGHDHQAPFFLFWDFKR